MPYKDPEKRKEYSKKYYKKNKDTFLLKAKTWCKKNKEKRKEIWTKYNLKKSTQIYKTRWQEIKKYDGNATKFGKECVMCKTKEHLVIHHRDGCNGKNGKTLNNHPDNLVILCRSCHPKIHNHWGVKEVCV